MRMKSQKLTRKYQKKVSKILNVYADKVDKVWYKSSNIKYSECIDNEDDFKTLKVVFTNGTQYQYEKVPVTDYIMFRESDSQGKALNKIIKTGGYEYKKLDNADLDAIDNELEFMTGDGLVITNGSDGFTLKNSHGEILYEQSGEASDDAVTLLVNVLKLIGNKVKIS